MQACNPCIQVSAPAARYVAPSSDAHRDGRHSPAACYAAPPSTAHRDGRHSPAASYAAPPSPAHRDGRHSPSACYAAPPSTAHRDGRHSPAASYAAPPSPAHRDGRHSPSACYAAPPSTAHRDGRHSPAASYAAPPSTAHRDGRHSPSNRRPEKLIFTRRPCEHNAWDNVRTKKGYIYLRCRVCEKQWKGKRIVRCVQFSEEGNCPHGAACANVHIFAKKNTLEERFAHHGESVLARVRPDRAQEVLEEDELPELLDSDCASESEDNHDFTVSTSMYSTNSEDVETLATCSPVSLSPMGAILPAPIPAMPAVPYNMQLMYLLQQQRMLVSPLQLSPRAPLAQP